MCVAAWTSQNRQSFIASSTFKDRFHVQSNILTEFFHVAYKTQVTWSLSGLTPVLVSWNHKASEQNVITSSPKLLNELCALATSTLTACNVCATETEKQFQTMRRAEPEPGSVIADRNRATGGQRWDQTVPYSGDTSRQRPCLLGVSSISASLLYATCCEAGGGSISQAARCVNGDTSFLWEPRVTFLLFSGPPLEVRPPNRFWRKMAQTTWIHARMCHLQ